jgi:concanavalin A-like lectin/glucanase superfamily protein
MAFAATAQTNAARGFLVYDGRTSYAEIPSAPQLSVGAAGLTVAVWMRPDVLSFPKTSGSSPIEQYVHWLGKGAGGHQEWTFRMYSQVPGDDRGNRISFYVFNPTGSYGCGSYFQDPITPGQWIHVVGVVDANAQTTAIYKNGVFRHSDRYVGGTVTIAPAPGSAPMRFGSKDLTNYFEGAIGPVRVWNRPLTASEISALYASNTVPPNGLVAAYALTEGQGTTIVDSVAANNGTLYNATWGQGARQPVASATGRSGGGC